MESYSFTEFFKSIIYKIHGTYTYYNKYGLIALKLVFMLSQKIYKKLIEYDKALILYT